MKASAIKISDKRDTNGRIMWECRCDCGKTTYAVGFRLTSGVKKSCGCQNRDMEKIESKYIFEAAKDCLSYSDGVCVGLNEMLCRTNYHCPFYKKRK